MWTSIRGMVEILPPHMEDDNEAEFILKTVLEHLPTIGECGTCAELHLVKKKDSSGSCSHNRFGVDMRYAPVKRLGFKEDTDYDMRVWKTSHRYFVIISGDFRGTNAEEIFRQTIKFLNRLCKRTGGDPMSTMITIEDDFGNRKVIDEYHGTGWFSEEAWTLEKILKMTYDGWGMKFEAKLDGKDLC